MVQKVNIIQKDVLANLLMTYLASAQLIVSQKDAHIVDVLVLALLVFHAIVDNTFIHKGAILLDALENTIMKNVCVRLVQQNFTQQVANVLLNITEVVAHAQLI